MPNREIVLLRHAHAEPATAGIADHDRSLDAHGHREADAAAAWLAGQAVAPDRILCSAAMRARQTCASVLAVLGLGEPHIDDRIYDASAGTLIDVLDENSDARCLLLVGHNPGLESVAALLSTGASDMGRGLPPGGIVRLVVPEGRALEPGSAEIRHFWWP